jgi:Omp85 superfamily domain/WD40-like Beta Propeller Repeat
MPGKTRTPLRAFAAAVLLAIVPTSAHSASLFDPALRFRTIRTEHFRIHFHQQSDALAARLAVIAEDVWRRLERPLGVRPPRLTQVVIADQTELPNAYATPFPYDTIVIYPTWPIGAEFDVDDWLRLVFTHEFTHIVHLDRSESWARIVRGMFGRTVLAFPNLFLPTWQIEGLAVYEESALTGEGRLHAGDFRAVVDEAARTRALLPLDRVNGGLTAWPSGLAPYAYGAAFHEYLSDRFGADTLAKLADATARRVPYTASRVFPRIFGESLGQLWSDFEDTRTSDAGAASRDERITRITRHGFVTAGPRFDRSCAGCPAEIVYTKRTPDGFPSLNRISTTTATKLANRYFGTTTGIGRDAWYFDQLEVQRNVALYGDLYRMDRATGRVTRLTWGARLHDPDLSPDGETLAAVQEKRGTRDLVLVRLVRLKADTTVTATTVTATTVTATTVTATTATLVSEPDTQFNAPRWSPDGTSIAVERHRLGSDPEIVIVDVATHSVRIAASLAHTRIVMPAWRPDGHAIVAAVAAEDRPFNLVEFDLESNRSRQLTQTTGGATWPDVSLDGKTLLFVGYTADGYDVYSMPYPIDERRPAEIGATEASRSSEAQPAVQSAASTDYSPLGTLKPTSWTPIVESDSTQTRVGAATGGFDVLGYHAYAASATWLVSSPSDAIKPSTASPDWSVAYAYARWRVTPFASAASTTTFFAGPATAAGTPSTATKREREIESGLLLPFVRVRHSHVAFASFFRAGDEYTLPDGTLSRDRNAIRAAWRTTTARTYGYSISQEDGIAAGATVEWVRTALGASADATTTTGDLRAYLPGLAPHHVVAARVAGGVSSGDPIVGRTFVLGGPASEISVIDFGSGAVSLLRGFASNSFAGSHVALANLEYRVPIARPQRGPGTWPFFLHTIHAAGFFDAGHAWTRTFDASSIKTSVGAELSTNLVIGFFFPLTATVGVARGHDGSGTLPDGTRVYFRVGKSF